MTYLLLFWEFFKIGLFTFGGGYAMIPLIKDAVISNSWITEEAFTNFIGVCESTPGPVAVNMATYIGKEVGGVFGSVCATFGVVLPSFIIILLVATILSKIITNKYLKRFIEGLKPVIMALILSTGLFLLIKALGYESLEAFNLNIKSLIIFCILVEIYIIYKLIFKKKMNAVLLILISVLVGIGVNLVYLI